MTAEQAAGVRATEIVDRPSVVWYVHAVMSKPQFTADEQYVMRAVQSKTASALSNSYMWGYLTGGVLLAGFAAYHESMPMLLSAFVVVCGFRIYEERNNARWAPVWQSILEKYEVALAGESGELDRSDHS